MMEGSSRRSAFASARNFILSIPAKRAIYPHLASAPSQLETFDSNRRGRAAG
jgi:hypothetical protein